MFPFLTAFMIFIIVLAVLRARVTRSEKERTDAFWEKESKANSARKVDLATITYFQFDPDSLPAAPDGSSDLKSARDAIVDASKQQMLNLNGISNTDLKLTYGPQNLEELTIYGDHFSDLEEAILSYGTLLHDEGYLKEAIAVLEKGILLPTDLTQNYIRLADYYTEAKTVAKRADLLSLAEKNLTGYALSTVQRHLSPREDTPDKGH